MLMSRGRPVEAADLPAEVLMDIMERLPGASLSAVRLVNRRWRELADNTLLRARFFFPDEALVSEEVCELVTARTALDSITLKDHQLTSAVLECCVRHPNLRTLRVVERGGGSYPGLGFNCLHYNIWTRKLEASWKIEADGSRKERSWGRGPAWGCGPAKMLVLRADPQSSIFGEVEAIYKLHDNSRRQEAGGRRQEAVGRRQEAGGRRLP
jgi:hypothetical protein